MKTNPISVNIASKTGIYLKKVSKEYLTADFPMEHLDLKILEGIQEDIPLLNNIKMEEIKFLTKNFSVLNIGRNCTSQCSHCLRNAQLPNETSTILWDDLLRFINGFGELNSRMETNIFKGNKYFVLHDDFNPPEFAARDLNGNVHNFAEAVKLVFEKFKTPVETVTSGWNKADKFSEKAAAELVDYFDRNPEANALTSVSVNPFHGLLTRSRNEAAAGNPEQARFWREVYTNRIAHAIQTFFPLFKNDNASLIYRHAVKDCPEKGVGAEETAKLYREIYKKLETLIGTPLSQVENLKPEKFELELPERFIEPKGRGRKYFSQTENLKKQQELISEKNEWETSAPEMRVKDAYRYTVKEADINGDIYCGTLSESMIKTGIKLNYINKDTKTAPLFSDIKLSELSKNDIIEYL